MNKIVFICPYFGTLPFEQMKLFLKSCEYNNKYDFIIITDDQTEFNSSDNVKFIYYSFEELKNYIQSKFDFNLNIETPYKLCDFKPAYGYIFSNLIKKYDFWGHCDISDMVLGDLSAFISYDSIKDYDKINYLGHLTLYKNTEEVNQRIFLKCNDKYEIKDIFGNKDNMAYDENMEYGINKIYIDYKYKQRIIDKMYSDIAPKYFCFREAKTNSNYDFYYPSTKFIYKWCNGKLFKFHIDNNKIIKEEIGYCHYQKRKMDFTKLDVELNSFIIVPNKFISFEGEITKQIIIENTKNKFYVQRYKLMFNNFKKRLKDFLK